MNRKLERLLLVISLILITLSSCAKKDETTKNELLGYSDELLVENTSEAPKPWAYDPGPNLKTKMGKELVDITAQIPNMPEISKKIIGRKQKFRPAFGPIPWRMVPDENKVKMLFIGQDGTHIAEAAGRPATAGFGGRAQDLANFFGVNEGAAFINTYAFTIKGQYGVYNTPYVYKKGDKTWVRFANLVDNKLWAISQNLSSPIVKWRNNLIDWIIRNNKKSMKLIVLFGGAARDAIATFARSKGAEVKAYEEENMSNIQVPETSEEYAGGNNTFPSLVARDGGDLYSDLLEKDVDYSKINDQKIVIESLKENLSSYIDKMVFTKGGPYKNGLLNPAQLGGYNLSEMYINGMKTRSLKGLKLDDGTVIENDIIVIELPHPSSLSRTVMEASSYYEGTLQASKRVMSKVNVLNEYAENGWLIEADPGKTNFFAEGKNYEYGRSDIGPEFYDFGTPENRMVSRSSARRMSGAPNVVIIGTRDNGSFPKAKIERMTTMKAAPGINSNNLFTARPSSIEERYDYDSGPGEKFAKIMIENLNLSEIFRTKKDMSWEKDGIDAYNVKTNESVSDFGHYRGTFKNPEIVILADPIGYDDIATARALTGERGQYLHGLMRDMGVNEKYLVFKTVPFGMDDATEDEWNIVLDQTKRYREAVLEELLKTSSPKLILTDGEYANSEALRILKNKNIPVVNIERKPEANDYGIKQAAQEIKKLNLFGDFEATSNIANIPRSHLSFYARTWEGTSGDRVITSKGIKYKGEAFAVVVPEWAYNQELDLSEKSFDETDELIQILDQNNLPLPYESIPNYLRRTNMDPSIGLIDTLMDFVLEAA